MMAKKVHDPKQEQLDELGYDPDNYHLFPDIFTQFDDAAKLWPLPLEWLIESVKAGYALPHDRPAPGN